MSGCRSEAGRLFQSLGPATEKLLSASPVFARTLAWAERNLGRPESAVSWLGHIKAFRVIDFATVCEFMLVSFTFLHCCDTRRGGRQQSSDPTPWVECCRLMYTENSTAGLLLATYDTRTDHRCCCLTYECRPLRQQRSTAWRQTHTCRRRFGWRSECLLSEEMKHYFQMFNAVPPWLPTNDAVKFTDQ